MRRGATAEEIARRLLEMYGYKVISIRQRIRINDIDIGEVDIIAEDENGERYVVEVKSGKVGVGDIKNTYATAKILNMKPIIICKDFSDESAKTAAERLKVKVIRIAKYLLIEPEELSIFLKESIRGIIEDEIINIIDALMIDQESLKFLKVIVESQNMDQLLKLSGLNSREIGRKISDLRKKCRLMKDVKGFYDLRRKAELIVRLQELVKIIRKMILEDK